MFYPLDKITVNFERGRILIGSITHEALHLLFRQHNWIEKYPQIIDLSKKYPVLSISRFGVGYQIEQMIAYLVQRDIDRIVGKQFEDPSLISWGDASFFESVILSEFTYDDKSEGERNFLIKTGRQIINLWDDKNQKHEMDLILSKLFSLIN